MGLATKFLRTDGNAGHVDLSKLAEPSEDLTRKQIEKISFRVTSGLWYILTSNESTELLPNDIISPVELEIGDSARIGYRGEELVLAVKSMRNWLTESRHFPSNGVVSLVNGIKQEGDRLVMNGYQTSPIDVAWVVEPKIPPDPGYTRQTTGGGTI